MKIGNASFNVEAVKKMSFDEFSATFKGKLFAPNKTLEQVYEEVTGRKPDEKSENKKVYEPKREKKVIKPDETKGDDVNDSNDSGE